MNTIYITDESKNVLINNLHACKKGMMYGYTSKINLIFEKIYPDIEIILQSCFINDLSNIIMEYVNDCIELKYSIIIEYKYDSIIFESYNTNIGLQEYSFKYMLTLHNKKLTIFQNTHSNICEYQSGKRHIYGKDYDILRSVYINDSIVAIINKFMNCEYIKNHYVCDCNIIDNIYIMSDKNSSTSIKILNKEKMYNMIMIIKIMADIFEKIDVL